MSLDLRKDTIEQLTVTLREWLQNVLVDYNQYIDDDSCSTLEKMEGVLPKSGKRREEIEEYIDETPFSSFIFLTLSRELRETNTFNLEIKGNKLNNYKGYENLDLVATRLVGEFVSLPNEYVLTIPFPKDFSELYIKKVSKPIDISSNIRFVIPDEEYKNKFSLVSGIAERDKIISQQGNPFSQLLSKAPKKEWNQKYVYLQISFKGFVGLYGETRTLENAIVSLKAFLGLCIAMRLLTVNKSNKRAGVSTHYFIHIKQADNWVVWRKNELENAQSAVISNLVLEDVTGLDSKKDIDDQKLIWLIFVLKYIFNAYCKHDNTAKIIQASQWLFDSHCSTDELLSFIQATIVMEILLGGKNEVQGVGISELLGNRCAYLISDSCSQRKETLRDFKNIYAIRSNIVHTGKNHLNNNERLLLNKLKWLCRRVIYKEIELIEKDVANNSAT